MKNKIKTHKASKKRFKISGSGQIRHNKQGDNDHLKIFKSRAQKSRKKGKTDLGSKKEEIKIKGLIN